MRFICSDETLNSYGFYVLTAGIDTRRFLQNPIMLWNHSRSYGSKNDVLPIGCWKDIKIEDGKLTADAVFDEKDDFARQIAGKVNDGIIRACSIGIRVLTTSAESQYLKPGQTRETVIACELKEISLCDIPANGNAVAVALYDQDDRLIHLGDAMPAALPNELNQKSKRMNKVIETLGLSAGSSEDAVVAEITRLRDEVATLKRERQEAADATLNEMITTAIRDRKTTEGKREMYMNIGRTSGVDTLRSVLAELSAPVRPSQLINPQGATLGDKKFSECSADELENMRANDPQRYTALFEAEYGLMPEL